MTESLNMKFLFVILVIFAVFILLGTVFNAISREVCKSECSFKNALTYDIRETGTISDKDYCICYYPNKIEVFKLK